MLPGIFTVFTAENNKKVCMGLYIPEKSGHTITDLKREALKEANGKISRDQRMLLSLDPPPMITHER